MDQDLREYLREIKESQRDGLSRLESKIDAQSEILIAHTVGLAEVRASATAAHERIDAHRRSHEERKKWFATLWGGVILLGLERFWHFFSGGGK